MEIFLAETDVRKKTWLVEISLKPIGVRASEFQKQGEKDYDELLLERAKKENNCTSGDPDQPFEHRVPEIMVIGPFGELDLTSELRLQPDAIF